MIINNRNINFEIFELENELLYEKSMRMLQKSLDSLEIEQFKSVYDKYTMACMAIREFFNILFNKDISSLLFNEQSTQADYFHAVIDLSHNVKNQRKYVKGLVIDIDRMKIK